MRICWQISETRNKQKKKKNEEQVQSKENYQATLLGQMYIRYI